MNYILRSLNILTKLSSFSSKITLGRTTKDHAVDVDLKLEGPAWKISRKQGVIKLRSTGDFFIANEGKRSIFVDGQPVSNNDYKKSIPIF